MRMNAPMDELAIDLRYMTVIHVNLLHEMSARNPTQQGIEPEVCAREEDAKAALNEDGAKAATATTSDEKA